MLRRRRTVIVGLMTTACVHANGIDIYYVEAGEGEPLLLLDNAMVSTNPVWAALPFAYASFAGTLAEHFRVIAPDTRGSGKSVHPGGPIPAALLADDVAALIEALNLDRPLICGFSDGGETATLVGIRHPGSVRAIVNHGGYDLFNPDPHAPAIAMTRQMLGGSAGATQADPEVSASRSPELRAMFELMKADHDSAQGAGHWKTVVARTFDRVTEPHGYTVEDLKAVTVPTLYPHRRQGPVLHHRGRGGRLPRPAGGRVRGAAGHRAPDHSRRRAGHDRVLRAP